MERNDDNIGNPGSTGNAGQGGFGGSTGGTTGSYGSSSDVTGAGGYGAAGSAGAETPYSAETGLGGTAGSTAGTGGSFGSTTPGTDGAADRAREVAGGARERLADAGATLREKAGGARNSLADMLEAGANRLNSQAGSTQLAGATGTAAVANDGNRIAAVAGGLQGSADWLREADLDGIKSGVENQVRTNPGRTLLIAAGLGYLLGKAFRR